MRPTLIVVALALLTSAASGQSLINASARCHLSEGGQVILGFVVADEPSIVLVRAVGPSLLDLGVSGVVRDPRIELYRGSEIIAENDDWVEGLPFWMTWFSGRAGAFPLRDEHDAALIRTLEPGAYTAVVRGEGAGEVLVEVYQVRGG